jgi:hypothetical protein
LLLPLRGRGFGTGFAPLEFFPLCFGLCRAGAAAGWRGAAPSALRRAAAWAGPFSSASFDRLHWIVYPFLIYPDAQSLAAALCHLCRQAWLVRRLAASLAMLFWRQGAGAFWLCRRRWRCSSGCAAMFPGFPGTFG